MHALLAVVVGAVVGCAGVGWYVHGRVAVGSGLAVYPRYEQLPLVSPVAKYKTAVDDAHEHGLRVWLESDLVARWKAGPTEFNQAIEQLAALATRPGVVGIKIADELGGKDNLSESDIMRFLRTARAALHANAPGKLVLIDIIGYQLGCAPGLALTRVHTAECDFEERAAHPAVTLGTIDRIVDSGYVDVIDLTTNMQEPTVYASWGITRAQAQRAAFAEVHLRGWDAKVRLQTRKALAFPTQQIPDAQTAAALIPDFVDVPRSLNITAIDIWTFSQMYAGTMVHLMDPGLQTNVLWAQLQLRHREGEVMFTHYSPSFGYGPSLDADMTAIATAFTDVFCAAGTG